MSDAVVVQRDDGRLWVLRGSTWARVQYVGSSAVNFGALPGSDGAVAVVVGQTGILDSSLVSAQIRLVSSVDHTADEHRVENLKITAGAIVPGVGFTVYADCVEGFAYGVFNVDWEWI